ncbi:UDP-N-acetylmuramoyl-L-alanine--D-glutamate ligase [Nesterenkonia sp. MY13]|uniref:UDP-N-acetylmuramoylalanine--D-glutamate ligase n=1 Tax=Nesterenkonia sedimenti TaxID=1463632 RepID=A0A7X8TLL1_9MICC|nr:UDP-N-acetylmuramoyl-L-alanine--D-glutamate ligase [Nesterenkonia sedimenti]NLS10258.1 UDP-N-acetylmuramoyl-L-alanine--D-glutamate ligase [Nesterenkonia sedimenti]
MSATLPELHGWDGPWKGLKVLVTGLGVTGFSAADTLAELGAEVVVVDGVETEKKRMDAATLQIVGVADIRFGKEHTENLPEGLDLIVTSPGWRPDSPLISAATAAGIPVWSDIQLARRLGPRPGARSPEWLVLTGTNGKTTTVTLLEQMLIAAGRRAVACGNIGMPILDAIRDPEGFDALAVELSSFQLHYTEPLQPLAAAVLNLAEDHVDWHGSQEEYAAAKAKIYEGTRIACVYNVEDPTTEKMVAEADVTEGCRAIGFTTGVPDVSMLGVVDTEEGDALLIDRAYLDNRRNQALELAARSDFGPLAPAHLVANALAAAALARAAEVPPEAVKQAVVDYQAAEHRIQPVAKADDVLWINDTKATNPHAAAASLAAFTDVVWIAGGLPKGVDYTDLVQQAGHRLRHVILIGTDSFQLRSSLERHAPQVPITEVSTGDDGQRAMREAVAAAEDVAQPGQTVLLAPAAASMDQFASYQERGEAFIEAVAELMQRKGFTT